MEYRIHRFGSPRAETEKQQTLEKLLEMNSTMDELITRPLVLKMSFVNVRGHVREKGKVGKIEFDRDGPWRIE